MERNAALGAVVGMLSYGLVGSLFGAVTGTFLARSGRAAGARIGRWVADSFTSLSDHAYSPTAHGALVGAADGAFFLGLVGSCVGLLASLSTLFWALAGLVALCLLAILFGIFAYALVGGNRWVAFACGPVVGWLVGFCLTDGNPYAGLAGTFLGILVASLVRQR